VPYEARRFPVTKCANELGSLACASPRLRKSGAAMQLRLAVHSSSPPGCFGASKAPEKLRATVQRSMRIVLSHALSTILSAPLGHWVAMRRIHVEEDGWPPTGSRDWASQSAKTRLAGATALIHPAGRSTSQKGDARNVMPVRRLPTRPPAYAVHPAHRLPRISKPRPRQMFPRMCVGIRTPFGDQTVLEQEDRANRPMPHPNVHTGPAGCPPREPHDRSI
jgi:hypothetical protein